MTLNLTVSECEQTELGDHNVLDTVPAVSSTPATTQQQRVFLVGGQAVYLEGDVDLTDEVFQQALAQLASGTVCAGTFDSDVLGDIHTAPALGAASTAITTTRSGGDYDRTLTADANVVDSAAGAGSQLSCTAEDTVCDLTKSADTLGAGALVSTDAGGVTMVTGGVSMATGVNESTLLDGATLGAIEPAVDGDGGLPVKSVTAGTEHDQQQKQQQQQQSRAVIGGAEHKDGVEAVYEEGEEDDVGEDDDDDEDGGVLAVLQDDSGEQQTVRLTRRQASVLGINYNELLAAVSSDTLGGQCGDSIEAAGIKENGSGLLADTLCPDDILNSDVTSTSLSRDHVVRKDVANSVTSGNLVQHTDNNGKISYTFQMLNDNTTTSSCPIDHSSMDHTSSQLSSMADADRLLDSAINSNDLFSKTLSDISSTTQYTSSNALNDNDVPVILTPFHGRQMPDYIEPSPGLKVLIRPLRTEDERGDTVPAASQGDTGAQQQQLAPGRKPLGSSDNPIQLVQQGNTFISTQALNCEQLKQIATVLQQNRLNVPSNTKNTVFDSNTNTRVVYRVVYPEDSRNCSGSELEPLTSRSADMSAQGSVDNRLSSMQDQDMDWTNSLDSEGRDVKKKNTTKTRTGRLSKPPKHMISDYRHIHRLNLNAPDLDDSDGGYSEIDIDEMSDEEQKTTQLEPPCLPDVLPQRPKRPVSKGLRDRFSCRTCGALCIGYTRLESHYVKFPDHLRPPLYGVPATCLANAVSKNSVTVVGGVTVVNTPNRRGRPAKIRPPVVTTVVSAPPPQSGSTGACVGGMSSTASAISSPAKRSGAQNTPSSADEIFNSIIEFSGTNPTKLCSTMLFLLNMFRQHASTHYTRVGSVDSFSLSSLDTFTVDTTQEQLLGLPAGTYTTSSGAAERCGSAIKQPATTALQSHAKHARLFPPSSPDSGLLSTPGVSPANSLRLSRSSARLPDSGCSLITGAEFGIGDGHITEPTTGGASVSHVLDTFVSQLVQSPATHEGVYGDNSTDLFHDSTVAVTSASVSAGRYSQSLIGSIESVSANSTGITL